MLKGGYPSTSSSSNFFVVASHILIDTLGIVKRGIAFFQADSDLGKNFSLPHRTGKVRKKVRHVTKAAGNNQAALSLSSGSCHKAFWR